jgi:hypothetical protein
LPSQKASFALFLRSATQELVRASLELQSKLWPEKRLRHCLWICACDWGYIAPGGRFRAGVRAGQFEFMFFILREEKDYEEKSGGMYGSFA